MKLALKSSINTVRIVWSQIWLIYTILRYLSSLFYHSIITNITGTTLYVMVVIYETFVKLRDNLFVHFSLIQVIYTACVLIVRKNLTKHTLQYNRLKEYEIWNQSVTYLPNILYRR